MPNALNSGLVFLINVIFGLFLTILVIRLILVYVKANYFDPITQFIAKLTDFIVKPLRKVIPNIGNVELANLIIVLILEIIKFSLLISLLFGMPNIFSVLILSIGDALHLIIEVFFYAILFHVVLTWLQPGSSLSRLLYQFTAPIMQPFHRIIPPIAGVDISPIFALITLQLLNIILVNPIMSSGYGSGLGLM